MSRSAFRKLRWRVCLTLTASLLAATGVAAQTFKAVAFGDSITAAEGGGPCGQWPCQYDQGDGDGFNWGYPERLESTDSRFGLGPGYQVNNRGEPGERTAEGLSRLNGVLGEGYHVLLLMEGTNDIIWHGVPVETVKANLRAMDVKANNFGTDTVFSTIIRKNKDQNNAQVTAMKNAILALANERDRYVVEHNWTDLCPTTQCFNANYYFTDPDDDKAGHPNGDGYHIMATNWAQVIDAKPPPGATIPRSPSGETGDPTPNFVWDSVSAANYYQLEVTGPSGGTAYTFWHRGSSLCSGGSCDLDLPTALGDGNHTWRVRTRNPRGLGTWSGSLAIDVYATDPAAPVALAPSGSFCNTFNERFSWTSVHRATEYRLWIRNAQGSTVVNDIFDADAICSGNTCETPRISLGNGSFNWQVFGRNPHGEGAGSNQLFIDVANQVPSSPAQIGPDWLTFKRRPKFSFLATPTADEYQVRIDGANQAWVDADSACTDGVCSFVPAVNLAIGDHDWDVRAKNCLGNGPFSSPSLDFEILPCDSVNQLPISRNVRGPVTETGCMRLVTTEGNPGYRIVSGEVIFLTGADGAIELANGFEVESGAQFIAVAEE